MPDIPKEVFDRDIEWPKPNERIRAEEISHPGIIPDTPDGPFKDWVKEKVQDAEPSEESSFRVASPDQTSEQSEFGGDVGVHDEEIGYEGER